MRYLLWQLRHLHTFHFEIINGVPTCPACDATYQKRTKAMSTNPQPEETSKPSKAPKSTLVITAFVLLFAAIFLVTAAAVFALPYLAALAIVDGLAAVTFAILSLRETV